MEDIMLLKDNYSNKKNPQMRILEDASDGIWTRASFFRRIDLPGTPYIPLLPEYINTRFRASPHHHNLKSNFTYNPIKASQEWVICLEKPSFAEEAYQG